jgi:hypothetical protein
MPVSSEHVVHLNESSLPPKIGRVIRLVRRSRNVTLGGETIEHESVMVRTRVDDSHRIDQEVEREHLRPATNADLYQSGQFVQVPDDRSGNAVFGKVGDPNEAATVESPHADSGQRLTDLAWVRHSDGTTKRWAPAQITPAV